MRGLLIAEINLSLPKSLTVWSLAADFGNLLVHHLAKVVWCERGRSGLSVLAIQVGIGIGILPQF